MFLFVCLGPTFKVWMKKEKEREGNNLVNGIQHGRSRDGLLFLAPVLNTVPQAVGA